MKHITIGILLALTLPACSSDWFDETWFVQVTDFFIYAHDVPPGNYEVRVSMYVDADRGCAHPGSINVNITGNMQSLTIPEIDKGHVSASMRLEIRQDGGYLFAFPPNSCISLIPGVQPGLGLACIGYDSSNCVPWSFVGTLTGLSCRSTSNGIADCGSMAPVADHRLTMFNSDAGN